MITAHRGETVHQNLYSDSGLRIFLKPARRRSHSSLAKSTEQGRDVKLNNKKVKRERIGWEAGGRETSSAHAVLHPTPILHFGVFVPGCTIMQIWIAGGNQLWSQASK